MRGILVTLRKRYAQSREQGRPDESREQGGPDESREQGGPEERNGEEARARSAVAAVPVPAAAATAGFAGALHRPADATGISREAPGEARA